MSALLLVFAMSALPAHPEQLLGARPMLEFSEEKGDGEEMIWRVHVTNPYQSICFVRIQVDLALPGDPHLEDLLDDGGGRSRVLFPQEEHELSISYTLKDGAPHDHVPQAYLANVLAGRTEVRGKESFCRLSPTVSVNERVIALAIRCEQLFNTTYSRWLQALEENRGFFEAKAFVWDHCLDHVADFSARAASRMVKDDVQRSFGTGLPDHTL